MKSNWEEIWGNYGNLNWFGARLKKSQKKTLQSVLKKMHLTKRANILDVGCGTGSTLKMFRDFGYKNSFGADFSKESIKVCQKLYGFEAGKDTFVRDARNLKFKSRAFDLVFSDGMLEHLPSIDKAVAEMCRVSKKYVLIFQPNQSSFFSKIKELVSKFKEVSWEKEYPYSKMDYETKFAKYGFKLADEGSLNANEMMWLLLIK